MVDDIKIDFVDYVYKWIDAPLCDGDIRLASMKDIAAMKINAVEGRGTKKDFVDIYFLLRHFTLEQILSFYKAKYPENSEFRALMSLTYFDDAEPQIAPEMLIPCRVGKDEMKQSGKLCGSFRKKHFFKIISRCISFHKRHIGFFFILSGNYNYTSFAIPVT